MMPRALSEYNALALGVETKSSVSPSAIRTRVNAATQGKSPISETAAPAFEVAAKYLYQSYFDDSLGPQAILSQSPGEPIVASTRAQQQVAGYSLGLHPSSQTPVTVRFFTGGQQGASAPYRLVPGQVIRPHGKPGEASGTFSGFEYGLPFGWLGGGSALLVVMRTPDAQVAWNAVPEVIFHRMRLQIVTNTEIPVAASVAPNWPLRFPWPYATSGASNLAQKGQPGIAVSPTKVALRLRLGQLTPDPADMRMLFYGTNDFDLAADGTIASAVISGFQDMTWGSFQTYAGSTGVGTNQFPTQTFGENTQLARFACDEGGAVIFTDQTGLIDGEYVDVVRFGRL